MNVLVGAKLSRMKVRKRMETHIRGRKKGNVGSSGLESEAEELEVCCKHQMLSNRRGSADARAPTTRNQLSKAVATYESAIVFGDSGLCLHMYSQLICSLKYSRNPSMQPNAGHGPSLVIIE